MLHWDPLELARHKENQAMSQNWNWPNDSKIAMCACRIFELHRHPKIGLDESACKPHFQIAQEAVQGCDVGHRQLQKEFARWHLATMMRGVRSRINKTCA